MLRAAATLPLLLWLSVAPVLAADLPDFASLVAREQHSVVNVSSLRPVASVPGLPADDPFFDLLRRYVRPGAGEGESLGSGFVLDGAGHILTCAHVVADARRIVVTLVDGRQLPARLVGADRRSDVAVLQVHAADLRPVSFGDPRQLRTGDWVLAIGSPFGFEQSATAGIVSSTRRWLSDDHFVPHIQTDVAINPGNSGGPLFNGRGEVVGINSQIYSRTGGFMGVSFALPIDLARRVASEILAHGSMRWPWLGVVLGDLTPEGRHRLGDGAMVVQLQAHGPGWAGGIRPGDVITAVAREPVRNAADFLRLLNTLGRPGQPLEIDFRRDGQSLRSTTVTPAVAPPV